MYNTFNSQKRPTPEQFDRMWEILEEAFPPNELEPREVIEKTLDDERVSVTVHLSDFEEGVIDALIWYYDLPELVYIAYFAVDGKVRGLGIGGRMIDLQTMRFGMNGRPIVLEAEATPTPEAMKRISWYYDHGFECNRTIFRTPPLREGTEPTDMYLLSYDAKKLTQQQHAKVRDILLTEIYHVPAEELSWYAMPFVS